LDYLQLFKKAKFHSDILRPRTLAKSMSWFPLEYHLLSKTISYPKVINFLVTLRCNLRCEICHTADVLTTSKKGELSLEEIKTFVDQMAPFQPDWFFSGGEPFARLDLPEILAHIQSRGMQSSLVSNGLLIHDKLMGKIKKGSLRSVTVSVLGVREGHDKEVCKVGAYENLRNNLHLLHEAHPETSLYINCPLTPNLVDGLWELAKDFQDLPIRGVKFTHLNYLTMDEIRQYRSYCKKHQFDHARAHSYITDEEMTFMQEKLKNAPFKKLPFPIQFAPQLKEEELSGWYNSDFRSDRPCHFIWHSTYLYPNGDVKSCHFLQETFGNIREEPLIKIWNSDNYNRFRRTIKREMSPACSRCCKL